MPFQNPSNEERKEILEQAKTIAVVGLSDNPDKTSYMVTQAMQAKGYKIIPVNPTVKEVLGEKAVASLTEIEEPVDIINVFRRSEQIMPVAEEAVKYGKAKVFWLQQGIYNEEAAEYCEKHGMKVVMDQCIKVDHAILVRK
ncbi:CoA-binding protein [Ammoniphilus sp. CFH 90114]|uniref:CoA-binding protein n=1 Tax=Ammoniphilus sp. CFH 90114 TaxID=2493665 RepID=UPI00100F2D4D|nr:CoA-binding protein [Ammoniphilus sp. CFH 90114]RXT05752.1 CoA-binding protein [Ammoniphilus sp. CFH 90114]